MSKMMLSVLAVPGMINGASAKWMAAAPHPHFNLITTTPRPSQLQHSCSRPVSRFVRARVDEEILQPAAAVGITSWPAGCPFDPELELYGAQSRHEKQTRHHETSHEWTCGFCGKEFKTQHYIDLHMERRHMNETPSHGAICLADYCEIFDVCPRSYTGIESRSQRKARQKCNPQALAKTKQLCDDAILRCFPLDTNISRRLHSQMSRQWCQVLDCEVRKTRHKERSLIKTLAVSLIICLAIAGIVFCITAMCIVDSGDSFILHLRGKGLFSKEFAQQLLKMRIKTREAVGMDQRKAG